ncbi:MAG: hypothetical protein AAF591_14860 [Verrucomicrobiota bacterium]
MVSNRERDVAGQSIEIAGGGLAGLALGIGLRRRGVGVCLHEAGSYPRHRVCGEFINGVSAGTLAALGIDDLFEDALRLEQTRWYRDGEERHRARLPRPALAVSRYRLDDRMRERFEELGGELGTGSRVRFEEREGLVWAAGRAIEKEGTWVGLKSHFSGVEVSGDLEMHLGRGGYAGMAPVEDGYVNVCGLFPAGRLPAGERGVGLLLAVLRAYGLEGLAAKLEAGEHREGSFVGAAGFALGRQRSAGVGCSLGDAEAIIPPFTGNGMSMAFEAAETAAGPIERYARGETGWDAVCEEVRYGLERRFRTRLRTARVVHPLLLRPMGQKVLVGAGRAHLVPFRLMHSLLS